MNATETIILECNNAESIKAKTLGGLSSFTKLDKSTWTNNFESIEIKRGDALTMEYAIINQLGGSSDAIEFSPPTQEVPDKEYNGNSVIFEVEFYVNHNAINSVGLPFGTTDALTTLMGTQTANQFNLNRPLYPAGFVANNANIAGLRTSNRLLMTDCKKYTLLHPRFDIIFGTPDEFLQTDKRYIQYQQEKNFISPDNLANELTIKFHETNTNPPKLNASDLTTGNTPEQIKADEALGIIKPCSLINANPAPGYKPLQLGAFYTLNKNTWISRYCNLINTIIHPEGTIEQRESTITDQMAVLNPYKWINGIHFNNCTTYDLAGDTDYNPTPVPQVYPRIIARYSMNVAPLSTNLLPFEGAVGAEERTILQENMGIFTNIEASADNLDKIKLYFDSICKYYGTDLDEKEARKDKDNWSCILDIGRTDQSVNDNGTEIGTQPPSAVWGLTGTFICPTTSRKANNEDIDPTIEDTEHFYDGSIGVKPFFKDIVNEFNDYVGEITSPGAGILFFPDDTHIQFNKDVIINNINIYEHAKANNIGAYPYSYIDHGGSARLCLCFLVSKTAVNHLPTHLSIGNYIGFSPSFFDNSAILMINKDLSTAQTPNIPSENPYMNVGASDIQVTYSPALSAFGFGSLHTQRRKGFKDDTGSTTGAGNPIVVINEQLGLASNINAVNGRATGRLNRDGNANPEFHFQSQTNDINIGYSDSIAGIWIKDIYFGKTTFNPNQYTSAFLLQNPDVLDKIAVRASEENWYGSLLWKMGGEYIDFYSQFTNLSRGLRFNNNFWRNQSTIRSVAPFTTNSNVDCSTAPFLNIGGQAQPVAQQGLPNFGLGYDNNSALLLTGITSAEMIFTGEIKRSETGFYRIYTDFCNPTYIDGDGGQLNVIALALKSFNSNDFFYTYSPSYTMIADRDYVLSSITTSIRNSDGTLANVGDRCVIVYKITKPKLILSPSPETKQSEEGDLEEIVDELKELNTTTAMNNILLRGGSGQSAGGGGGRSSGGLGKDRLRQGEVRAINRDRGAGGGAIVNIGGDNVELPGRSSFLGVGRRLDEDEELIDEVMEEEGLATKEPEEIATKEAEPERVETMNPLFAGFRGTGDYSGLKNVLVRELVVNILNRIPTADLIDRNGNFDYRQYITIAGEVIPALYKRFSTIFNRRITDLERSGARDRRTIAELAQQLARVINGVEVNPQGRSFLSVPEASRRTAGQVGNLEAEISPEALEVLINDLLIEASPGDIQQVLEDFVATDNLSVNYQGEPIRMIDNLPERPETKEEREQRLGSLRGRYLPTRIAEVIQQARENSDGTAEGGVEWINQQLRNIAEGPEPRNREERLQQERYTLLLGDSRYYLITGNRQPRPLTRENVMDLHDRRVRQRRAEDSRFAEVQATEEPEYRGYDISYDPIGFDGGSMPIPQYARARATRQLQEIVNQQPEPPLPDIQTFKEERPKE